MNEEESVQSLSREEIVGKGRRGPSGVVAGAILHDRCQMGDRRGAYRMYPVVSVLSLDTRTGSNVRFLSETR